MEPSFAPKNPQEPTKLCPQKSPRAPSIAPKIPQEPPDDLTPMTSNPTPSTELEFLVNVEPTCVVMFQIQKQKLFTLI